MKTAIKIIAVVNIVAGILFVAVGVKYAELVLILEGAFFFIFGRFACPLLIKLIERYP